MTSMKLYIDNIDVAPEGYELCKTLEEAKEKILNTESEFLHNFRLSKPCTHLIIEEIKVTKKDYFSIIEWIKNIHQFYSISTIE